MSPVNTRKCPKLDREHLGELHTHISRNSFAHMLLFAYCREVFKAREKNSTTNKFVAMKKVLMENEKEGVSSHPEGRS